MFHYFMHMRAKICFWTLMILENFCFLLKFLLKQCYKDRFTYKIYNMTYFYVGLSGGGGPQVLLRHFDDGMMGSEHQSCYPLCR